MKTFSKIVTTLVLTTMLSLPLFGAVLSARPDVSWSSGTTNNWEWK